MLQFIFGRAGSGKSKFLRDLIYKKTKNGEKNIILIVPEQSSFANEKEIVDLLGNSECNNVNVLSFSRMHDFVAGKLHLPHSNPMSSTTQNIIMSSAIENVKNQLEIYYPNSKTDVEKIMLETIQEFKFQKIDLDKLKSSLNTSAKNILKQKTDEIALIINEYSNLCSGSFIDAADKINLLENQMREHNIFKDYTVIFDEFNSFTEQQIAIIDLILSQAKNVYMAFCTDNEQNRRIFIPMNKNIQNIKKIAKKNNVTVSQPIILSGSHRFKNHEIIELEKNIFGNQKTRFESTTDNINLYSALNIYEECENIAQNILKLIIEQKYHYNDIAILTRNMDCYQAALKNIFKKYNIPLFLSSTETILDKSLINLVLSALNCIISNFQTADVIRYMKSVLLDYPLDDVCNLENYTLLWNIKGNAWASTFTAHPKGYSTHWSDEDIKSLEKINSVKEKLLMPLINLKNKIAKKTSATSISRAIYEFLIEVNADKNLKQLYINLKSAGELQTAEKEAKTWDILMEILSLISQIMATKTLSAKDYLRILISGLEAVDCSSIPPTQDSVVAAQIPGARPSNPKVIFLIGVSDGEFPAPPKTSAIFTESETLHIESLGIKICENKDYVILNEQFLAYTALCSTSEKLFVSWSTSGSDTESSGAPSEIVHEIIEIFPRIKINNRNNNYINDTIWSENTAFDIYCSQKSKPSSLHNTLAKHFENSNSYAQKLLTLENFLNSTNLNFKNQKNSQALFGTNIKLSASQIDSYHKCPFGYLCKYGLNLKTVKPAKFSPLEHGNLMHKMFEKLFKKYPKNSILKVPMDILKNDISTIIDDYVKLFGDEFSKNPRIINIMENAKKSAFLLVERIVNEFQHSKFIVSDCELEVSGKSKIKPIKFDLGDNTTIEIEGKIDRVDTLKTDNGTYIRIVDYKTGKTDFDLSYVLYGLDMQTLIYLLTLTKNQYGKYNNSVPAGALYFKASQPLIDDESRPESETLTKEMIKEMRLNGLFLDNESVLNAMDNSENQDFINIKSNKQNEASATEFEDVFEYIEFIIKTMGMNIKNGVFDITPTGISNKNNGPCEFCDYLSVCHHDKNIFKKVKPLKRDNIFSEIKQKRSEFFSE